MRFKWEYPAFLGLLMTFAVVVVSCSKDATSPQTGIPRAEPRSSQQKLVDLQDKYGWTGKYHTDALAHVFDRLSHGQAFASKAEKCHAAVAALKEFNKSFSKDGKSKGMGDDFVSDAVCSGASIPNPAPAPAGINASLSPKAIAMLQQISNQFDSGASAAAVVSNVNAIESAASKSLSPEEAGAVVSLGSVAISSAQYWNANLPSWKSSLSSGGPVANVMTTGGVVPLANMSGGIDIGKADVVAFFGSLIFGWWMGAFDLEVSAVRAVIASLMAAL